MNDNVLESSFTDFVDREAMQAIFQRELPDFRAGKLTITDLSVSHTHYKLYLEPKTHHRSFFIACYRLLLNDEQTQQGEQLLYAKAYLNGRSKRKFDQIKQDELVPPRFGVPVVHLPALDMIVWSFPNDPDLPHLPLIVDPNQVRHYLPSRVLPGGSQGGTSALAADDATPFNVTAEVIRYKPGKRCTLHYIVQGQAQGSQRAECFGKMVADEAVASTYQQLIQLWRHSLVEPCAFGIAEPLSCDLQIHMLWQAAVPGAPLLEALRPGHERELLEAVAYGLADLHSSDLCPPTRKDIAYHITSAQEESAELSEAYPHCADLLRKLIAQIEQEAPHLPSSQEKPIHRDFHIQQLLLHEQRLYMFDFDDLSMGDPMQDLAFFIVDLHHRKLEPEWVGRWVSIFCQAYQAASGGSLPVARLKWHLYVQFLAKAYWLYKKRQQKQTIQQEILRTLNLALQPFPFHRDL